jgi:hypothetical protein
MKTFKDYLILSEAAKGLKDLTFSGPDNNFTNFRVQIADNGIFIRLYVNTPKGSKFAGDLHANECFNNTKLLPPYRLFAWHSDINESLANGFGPFLYDIAMETATLKGGYLTSHALVNRLMMRHLKDIDGDGKPDELDQDFYNRKGGSGGDPTDEAESVYKYYYYNRKDVESIMPNIIFGHPVAHKLGKLETLPEQHEKPYMYELYRKQPTTIQQMVNLNKQGKIVLIDAMNKPILNTNI